MNTAHPKSRQVFAPGWVEWWRALAAATLAALLLLSWVGGARAATKITVQLDWIANAQFAGLLVARERGWYEAVGLDVTIVPVDQTALDAVAPVVKGENMVGCADGLALLRARADHQPIRAFATMLQASPLGIVTPRASGLDRLAALKGKTIGLHAYDRPQLAIVLADAGLTLDDVVLKDIGDDTTSLPAGTIDAQVVYLIDEKVALETKGVALNVFPGDEHGYITYSQVYFAREDFLKSHPVELAAFLRVSNRGWQEAFDHPEAAAALLVREYLPGSSAEYQRRSIVELQRFATRETPQLGRMRLPTWRRSCELFHLDPALADSVADFSILDLLEKMP